MEGVTVTSIFLWSVLSEFRREFRGIRRGTNETTRVLLKASDSIISQMNSKQCQLLLATRAGRQDGRKKVGSREGLQNHERQDNEIYVGSTEQEIERRMQGHRCVSQNEEKKGSLYRKMREIGVDHFQIVLLEEKLVGSDVERKKFEQS